VRYIVHGKTAATAATIDHALAQLWNPSTAYRLRVKEVWVFKQAAGAADEPVLRRATARGTAGSTVTPTIVNNDERALAPPSGALLDMAAFTVQPTLEALGVAGGVLPAAIGTGYMWIFQNLVVPPGNGLVITTGIALAFPVSRVTFLWDELGE
jgi:hypothetical protein